MTEAKVKNVYQKIHEAMGKVDYVRKNEKSGMQYKFVSHDAVTAIVRPALHEAGVIYFPQNMKVRQDGNRTECNFDVRFMAVETAEWFDVPTFGYGIDNQDKGPGKAISYGVKYALLKTLGLETGDDPERDNVDHEKPEPKAKVDYSAQNNLINQVNKIKEKHTAVSWLDERQKEIDALPEEQKDTVMGQYESVLAHIEAGIEVPMAHKFSNTAESDSWCAGFVKDLEACLTPLAVNNLCFTNKAYLDGILGQYQGKKNTVHMQERIEAKRKSFDVRPAG